MASSHGQHVNAGMMLLICIADACAYLKAEECCADHIWERQHEFSRAFLHTKQGADESSGSRQKPQSTLAQMVSGTWRREFRLDEYAPG